ncbi:MAG: diguanylate cyclase [Alphaproteobacteria bacterium]
MTPAVNEADARRLLRFVGWTHEDAARLPALGHAIARHADVIIQRFYDHLELVPELDALLGMPEQRRRLRATQRSYLLSIGEGVGNPVYVEGRLRIGEAHERVGLVPRWYLGAYAKLEELIGAAVDAEHATDPEARRLYRATLAKVVRFDEILAIEAYHQVALARQDVLVHDLEDSRRNLEAAIRRDVLTGVRNRTAVLEDLHAEFDRSVRFRRPFTALFVDLDRFKAVNDRYGHAAGDAVLRHVVGALVGALRPADIIGRYGGEEFVIGLVECDGEEAGIVAGRLRAAVEARPIQIAVDSVAATVSIGLASLGPATTSIEELLDQADGAMYEAKRQGRNRVIEAVTQVMERRGGTAKA